MENKKLYLYVKESPSGLKYLGTTGSKNPYTYKGSGVYWKRHLKVHQYIFSDLKTTILFETFDREALKEKGLYYSKLWNIVESKEWANLCYESGEQSTLGYKLTETHVNKLKAWRRDHPIIISPEGRKRIGAHVRNMVKSQRQRESAANVWKNKKLPDYMKKAILDANSLKVININTGIKYDSIKEAAKSINICPSVLKNRLEHKLYICGFIYVDEKLNIKALEITKKRIINAGYRWNKKKTEIQGAVWSKDKNKWYSTIREDGKKRFLGYFNKQEDAHNIYMSEMQKIIQKQLDELCSIIEQYNKMNEYLNRKK